MSETPFVLTEYALSAAFPELDENQAKAILVAAELAGSHGAVVVLPPPPHEFAALEVGLRNECIRGLYSGGENIIKSATRAGGWQQNGQAVAAEKRGRAMLAGARVLEQYVMQGRASDPSVQAGAPGLFGDAGLGLDALRETATAMRLSIPDLDEAKLQAWIAELGPREQRELHEWARHAQLLPPAPVCMRDAPVRPPERELSPADLAAAQGVPVDGPALAKAMREGGIEAAVELSEGSRDGGGFDEEEPLEADDTAARLADDPVAPDDPAESE